MRLADIVKAKRQLLHEDQGTFGKRFGVTATAISFWEAGKRDVPNRVLEELLELPEAHAEICGACKGTGVVYR